MVWLSITKVDIPIEVNNRTFQRMAVQNRKAQGM